MGERSKTIGEKGEKVVDELLDLLGWVSTPINSSMPCTLPDKHKSKRAKKGKTTHGSDSSYAYKSPFFTGQLNHVIISSKYTDDQYPSGNSIFKEHFEDLSFTVECYRKSALRNQDNEYHSDIESEKISGLLFWLSNDEKELKSSLLPRLNPKLPSNLVYDTNYVVDSSRANFLYNCINNAKLNYPDYVLDFYYIDTGNNPSDCHKRFSGSELPLELMVSDIQIFILTKGDEKTLALYIRDCFSKDSLNRILGLARNIAKDLTKINIHFPDYQSDLHDSYIKQVKMGFDDRKMVDSINILSYDESIIKLGNKEQTTELPKNKEDYSAKLKANQILPYGNELRDLLSRSQITDNEINKLLRRKGVFVSNPTKDNLIPVMSSILLSPSEFDYLREKQKTREDSPKRTSSRPMKCSDKLKSEGLINVIKEIKLTDIVEFEFYSFKFHKNTLSFSMVDNNPNHVIATYTITKTENNKIWFDNKNEFTGEISIKLSDNGVTIRPISDSTSPDTLMINKWITKKIITDLKSEGLIDQNTEENKILMKSMSNEEIVKFLLSFTGVNDHRSEIKFRSIISMKVKIDEQITLPDSNKIKWMENKIKQLQLDGDKIEDTELITEKENHQYIKVWSMLSSYDLDSQLGKATFNIRFSFQKSVPHEFSFSIEKFTFKEVTSSIKKAQNRVLDKIDDIKLEKYEEIIQAR